MYKVMTPGPTQVKENVRMARSLVCTNPDLDEDFVEFYKDFESAVCAVEVDDVFINKILLFMVCICVNSQDCCWDYYIQKLS